MSRSTQKVSVRWLYLIVGVVAMLFAGIIYAWSILKSPLAEAFAWSNDTLALNFTLTMCFFCIGGLVGAQLSKRVGPKVSLIVAGVLGALGFILTSSMSGATYLMLFVSYGLLAGLGIGIAYNVVLSTVGAWFPDKKGFCSGCLMMGFGASALVLGNLADSLFDTVLGWRTTFVILGIALGVVLVVAGLLLKRPGADLVLPQPKAAKAAKGEDFERRDYTPVQMLLRPSFWMAFICLIFLSAVGNSVISFAKDLALSVEAPESLAVTLVGVLSVFNGLGRIITGAVFDVLGRRKTMIAANILTIVAAGITLIAVLAGSLPLCIVGLCLTGMSYGTCPTVSSAFTSAFYGMRYYSTNMAFMTFNLMGGSLIATLSSTLRTAYGGFVAPFIMLLALTVAALVLNLFIRRP